MMEWVESLPLGWAILLFWCGALLRSTTTYALGRGVAAGAEYTWLRRYLAGPVYARAARFIDRWGPWAIPFCFLTVGLQTAVIGTAGITRMRWRRFLPAALLGSLFWGIIYGTIGMAVVWAVLSTALASPWALAGLVVASVGIAFLIRWRTLRASRASRAPAVADDPGTAGTSESPGGRDAGDQEESTSDTGR
jgi:membrane protein DedA with SNARE-associated domain